MAGTLMPTPFQTVLDANGDPVSGALIYTYVAGTTTLATTYTDVGLTTANANPIVADSAGRFVAYLTSGSSYKFVYQDSGGASIRTQDNVSAVPPSSINVDITGTAGEAITAGQVVYLSDGSGSKTAGSWYKADSANPYSSSIPEVGMAPSAIASGASGTIRLEGQVTGLSSLTVGTSYYVSTSGALTSSAPTNRRLLGVADSTSSLVLNGNPSVPAVNVETCQGRLTVASGSPVNLTDQTAKTTLYFTPYKGNRVALYDGTNWSIRQFAELSIAIPATTSTMYDVFLYDNAGTLTLELLAWTNDTTRATALTTQDGIYVKTGATTRRYLGSFRTTTVSGQTEDSYVKRYVWNYYNRVSRPLVRQESTATWTYTTATFRQANANTANQIDVVVGVAEVTLTLDVVGNANNTGANNTFAVAIGEDSTTTALTTANQGFAISPAASVNVPIRASARIQPTAGRHFYAWLEISQAAGTTNWWGLNGMSSGNVSGIYGALEC